MGFGPSRAVTLTPVAPLRSVLGRRPREGSPGLEEAEAEEMDVEEGPPDPATAPLRRVPSWFAPPLANLRALVVRRTLAPQAGLLLPGEGRVSARAGEAATAVLRARPFPTVPLSPDGQTVPVRDWLLGLLGEEARGPIGALQEQDALLQGGAAAWLMVTWTYWVAGLLELPGARPPLGAQTTGGAARQQWSTRFLWMWTDDAAALAAVSGLSEAVLVGRLRELLPRVRAAGRPYAVLV